MNTVLTPRDSLLINRYRGLSIMRVVLVHLGLSWFFPPYSTYVGMFLPILFFCSGYLSLFLYRNRTSDRDFMIRRLTGIFIPFYLIYAVASLVSLALGQGNGFGSLAGVLQALIIAPETAQMPYPLGQIWFLRVVVFCTLFSPFFFKLSERRSLFLLAPVLAGAVVAVLRGVGLAGSHVTLVGYNILQCITYGAFYFLGSYFFALDWRTMRRRILAAMGLLLLAGLVGYRFSNGSLDLGDHSFIPDLFYFSLGTIGILLVMVLAPQLEGLFRVAPPRGCHLRLRRQAFLRHLPAALVLHPVRGRAAGLGGRHGQPPAGGGQDPVRDGAVHGGRHALHHGHPVDPAEAARKALAVKFAEG